MITYVRNPCMWTSSIMSNTELRTTPNRLSNFIRRGEDMAADRGLCTYVVRMCVRRHGFWGHASD